MGLGFALDLAVPLRLPVHLQVQVYCAGHARHKGHRVDRVLSFFSPVVGIGTSPPPYPQASVLPTPTVSIR